MSTWAEREARRIQKAVALISPGISTPGGVWADVGCGDGIFTLALHSLTRPGTEIYAIDKDRDALDALMRHAAESIPDAVIHPLHADFTHQLALTALDGMLMANALHFTQAQTAVLRQLVALLKPGGRLIVVEYNTLRAHSAVPYPLDERSFLALTGAVGLRDARIVARIPSSFLSEMYAGLATRPILP